MASPSIHDPALGLKYVGNNEGLYRKILGKFADQQANAAVAIEEAISAGDEELAHRLAHTLKGLSASMGLPALVESATALDTDFKNGGKGADIIPVVRANLEEALAAVREYLG